MSFGIPLKVIQGQHEYEKLSVVDFTQPQKLEDLNDHSDRFSTVQGYDERERVHNFNCIAIKRGDDTYSLRMS